MRVTGITWEFEGDQEALALPAGLDVATSGQLLRPGQDTVAPFIPLIEDERGTEPLQVFHLRPASSFQRPASSPRLPMSPLTKPLIVSTSEAAPVLVFVLRA